MLKPKTTIEDEGILFQAPAISGSSTEYMDDARMLHEVLPVLESLAKCARARMDDGEASSPECAAYEDYTKLLDKYNQPARG